MAIENERDKERAAAYQRTQEEIKKRRAEKGHEDITDKLTDLTILGINDAATTQKPDEKTEDGKGKKSDVE